MHTPIKNMFAFAAASLMAISACHASPRENDTVSKTVSYAGLDLESSTGAQVLYERIKAAATNLCYEAGFEYNERRKWKTCFAKAVDTAVRRVNREKLTVLHDSVSRNLSKG